MTTRAQTPPNLKGSAQVEFDQNEFEAVVWKKGYDILIESARVCPCTTNAQGQATCQNCRGYGWVFVNPIKSKGITTSLNQSTKFKDWSEERIGQFQLTVGKDTEIKYMDRVTYIDQYATFSELIKLRDNATDGTKFAFTAYEMTEITDAFIFNGDGTQLLKLTADEISIGTYNSYAIIVDKDMSGITDYNGVVSVTYKHKAQSHVIDFPHHLRASKDTDAYGNQQTIEMPKQMVVQTTHLALNKPDLETGKPIDNDYL